MEISLCMEAAEQNTKSFKSSDTPINKLISRTSAPVLGKSSRPCTHCGHPGHWQVTCKFKDAICHACSKVGHIAPACRTRLQGETTPTKSVSASSRFKKNCLHPTHKVQSEKIKYNIPCFI